MQAKNTQRSEKNEEAPRTLVAETKGASKAKVGERRQTILAFAQDHGIPVSSIAAELGGDPLAPSVTEYVIGKLFDLGFEADEKTGRVFKNKPPAKTLPLVEEPKTETTQALASDLDAILTGKPVSGLAAVAEKHGAKVISIVPHKPVTTSDTPPPDGAAQPTTPHTKQQSPTPGPVAFDERDHAERTLATAFNAGTTLNEKLSAVREAARALGGTETTRLLSALEKERGEATAAPFLLAVRLAVTTLGFDKPSAPAKDGSTPKPAKAAKEKKSKRAGGNGRNGSANIRGWGKDDCRVTIYLAGDDLAGLSDATSFKITRERTADGRLRVTAEVVS